MKKTITLVEAQNGHFYKIEDDELNESVFLPSSTNILTAFPNPGLTFWRENSSPEEIKKAQEDGKIQGTKVHKGIELQLLGQTVLGAGLSEAQISLLGLSEKKLIQYLKEPLTEREEEALVGFENWWGIFKPITVGSELMVYSLKYGFAGTLDWIGYLWDKKKGKYELWIVDWKISKSLDRSYDLQLASYWQAIQETYKKKFPEIRLGILQLGKNKCNYCFKEVKDKEVAWDLFLNTKKTYDDLFPNSNPKVVERRKEFKLNKFEKEGEIINLT